MSAYSKNGGKPANFREYVTARGIALRVHAVPQPIIRSITPKRPKPQVPTVTMQLPKGTQKRPANEKDAVWLTYQDDMQNWLREARELQEAVTFCMALKDFQYPAELTMSPQLRELADAGLITLPDDPYRQKMTWLRENVIGEHDEYEITMIIQSLSGVPEDIISEMKDSFRNTILGKKPEPVGATPDEEPTPEEGDEV